MDASPNTPLPSKLWEPSDEFRSNTRLIHYMTWLSKSHNLHFTTYDELWEWSTSEFQSFWESMTEYFEINFHHPYSAISSEDPMPNTRWFPGATLNYAEHIFRHADTPSPAIIYTSEEGTIHEMSWIELTVAVASMANYLTSLGIGKGDRVVAFIPNIPEATIAFLACCSLGVIWSSCSPDFGAESVVERFQQIHPSALITVDGYQYRGKTHDKISTVKQIIDQLPSLTKVVCLAHLQKDLSVFVEGGISWETMMEEYRKETIDFLPVPFDHPIWVLFSSGTTGIPKAITHSHGGVLLEHLKYLAFHNDVHPGERFFWFTTTGWMMWNFVQAALLVGATIVLYDGHPGYPNLDVLWKMAEEIGLHHFGTGAPYLIACMKKSLSPKSKYQLDSLKSLSSTGSPLPPETFHWVYQEVKEDIWLCSMSGGTDVCTAFVGGVPIEAVYMGEIQRRGLGCSMYAFDDEGQAVIDEVGEMVITRPMPSMPIYFWNDPNKERYMSSYFDTYPGVWRHGDWLQITSRNTLIILGRSDATLNRQGVRIGTAEIYRALNSITAIQDALIVNLELQGGDHYMPLFVVLEKDKQLNDTLIQHIKQHLRDTYSPRHVPDEIIAIPDIPYTISGKKLEAPVKKILMGKSIEKAANRGAMRNPASLNFFIKFREQLKSAKNI